MLRTSRTAGLICLKLLLRGVQLACSAIVASLYAYFLATLASHNLDTPTTIRVVEGIALIGTVFTFGGLTHACCMPKVATSIAAITIDFMLVIGFIFIAVTSRNGASGCSGPNVQSIFGTGPADAKAATSGPARNFVQFPTFGAACGLEKTALVAACIAAPFFFFSIVLELSAKRGRDRALRSTQHQYSEEMYPSKPYDYGPPPPPPSYPQQMYGGGGLRGLVLGALPLQPTYQGGGRTGRLQRLMTGPMNTQYGGPPHPQQTGGYMSGARPSHPYYQIGDYDGSGGGGRLRRLMNGAIPTFQPPLPPRPPQNPDALPMHQEPSQVRIRLELDEELGQISSRRNSDELFFNNGPQAPRRAASVYYEGTQHIEREYV